MIQVIHENKVIMTFAEGVQFTLPNGHVILSGEPGWTDGEYTIGRVDPSDPEGQYSLPEEHRQCGWYFKKDDFAYLDEDLYVRHKWSFFPYADKETLLENFAKYGISEEDILQAFEDLPDRTQGIQSKAAWKIFPFFGDCPSLTSITDHLGLTREQMNSLFETKKGT